MANELNSYELSRTWFDWCFINPDKINPNHSAVYFFAIEHCNRLGWKEKFGFPSSMVMEAVGIKSYNTYIKCLNELVEFGFINMVEKSKNQYSANIIALSNFNKAFNKALDKALAKHSTKQPQKQRESKYSIDKQYNNITKNNICTPALAGAIDPEKFITYFNSIGKRNFKLNHKIKKSLIERLKDYNSFEIKTAIDNAHKDVYHIETSFKYLTPEFILRPDKLERFLNQEEKHQLPDHGYIAP